MFSFWTPIKTLSTVFGHISSPLPCLVRVMLCPKLVSTVLSRILQGTTYHQRHNMGEVNVLFSDTDCSRTQVQDNAILQEFRQTNCAWWSRCTGLYRRNCCTLGTKHQHSQHKTPAGMQNSATDSWTSISYLCKWGRIAEKIESTSVISPNISALYLWSSVLNPSNCHMPATFPHSKAFWELHSANDPFPCDQISMWNLDVIAEHKREKSYQTRDRWMKAKLQS